MCGRKMRCFALYFACFALLFMDARSMPSTHSQSRRGASSGSVGIAKKNKTKEGGIDHSHTGLDCSGNERMNESKLGKSRSQ